MSSKNEKEIRTLVAAAEQARVARKVRDKMRTCPEKPVDKLDYEFLSAKSAGLTIATVQPAYKTKRFILGGYRAEYQFAIVYRLTAASPEERLQADEALDNMTAWAEARENWPELGEGVKVLSVKGDEAAKIVDRYDNGLEDHQITITITYERI